MELSSDINAWKRVLCLLESTDEPVTVEVLGNATRIFEHLPIEVAPRLRRDYDSCCTKSGKILADLFERVDLSDKRLLNMLLNLFIAYGNFKITQMVYSIDNNCRGDFTFVKTKWHELTPLLPPVGNSEELDWKSILIHGLVIEERQLYQTSLRLLTQKLHFHAIALFSNHFDESSSIIKKNGERVAEKITEKIKDFAHDDEEMIGIDSYLFDLLLPFTTNEQQVEIIEATIMDRFKCILTPLPDSKPSREITRIRSLICDCIMDKAHLQEALIIKLLEHLRCNIIRRKRRHSVEESGDNSRVTFESLISGILEGTELTDLVDRIDEVDISSKRLQISYLSEWVDFVNVVLTGKILTFHSSNILVATCFILFLTTSSLIESDLIVRILSLMTKALDNASQRKLERHFKTFGPNFLFKFIRTLLPRKELLGVLIFMMRIAIYRKDQEILDSFAELMPKLYNELISRVKMIADNIKLGSTVKPKLLDAQLAKLMNLYVDHKTVIQPYLSYNLYQEICKSLIFSTSTPEVANGDTLKSDKKATYNEIKSKLESLQERANRSQHIHQNIINQQYNLIVDQTIGQIGDIKSEGSCFKKYFTQLKSIVRVSTISLNNCDQQIYELTLDDITSELQNCDAFDHPKVLYLFLMLESLIPKQSKDSSNAKAFEAKLPQISFALIRISKSVELGPSVHLFTQAGTHKSAMSIQCCTYANCFRIYALIFNHYPFRITNSLLPDAMQISISCNLARYAKNSVRLHSFFIQLASSMACLLKSISMGKKDEGILRSSMPLYMSVLSLLIRCLVVASDRQKLQELPQPATNGRGDTNGNNHNQEALDESSCEVFESHLEFLARDIGRILNGLSYLEVKLVDYAPHLISTYIKDTQRASCPDFVRKHIDEGVFRIFNLVDAYQKKRQQEIVGSSQRKTSAGKASGSLFKMIYARLDQASREIFRSMHDEYSRFHRYLGKC